MKIAVVIPCYKVTPFVCEVIAGIGPETAAIYCVDDKCPDGSGRHIEAHSADPRVRVLYNESNLGVGGATIAGYRRALFDGADVLVKVDGDGQMDPALIPRFVAPIAAGRADYTKGNRFFDLDSLKSMPTWRLLSNAMLSFLTKLATGYWNIFDPTNGFTAIHARVFALLPAEKISQRYYFESDVLFRLNTIGAVVEDVPMAAVYGDETSNVRIGRALVEFPLKLTANFLKRIFYNYYLRGFSVASIELALGVPLLAFGVVFGLEKWWESYATGTPVTPGTVMLAALPIILGVQLVLSFLAYDTRSVSQPPLHLRL